MREWQEQIKSINEKLKLKLYPQAVKMITDESEIPSDAIRAGEKFGRMAYCQAQAMTKRNGKTVYLDRENNWCWAPLVGFGFVDASPSHPSFEKIAGAMGIQDMEAAKAFFGTFPKLPLGKYIGTLVAPAETCDFDPDVILINTDDNYQFRAMLWAIKTQTGKLLECELDAIDSCIHVIVRPMLTGEYGVAIPDPGDQERALSDKHEMILGVPLDRVKELAAGLEVIGNMKVGYMDMEMCMEYDYARPQFYNDIYEMWGLPTGKVWDR